MSEIQFNPGIRMQPIEGPKPQSTPGKKMDNLQPGLHERASELWGKVKNWLPFWKDELAHQPDRVIKQVAELEGALPENPPGGAKIQMSESSDATGFVKAEFAPEVASPVTAETAAQMISGTLPREDLDKDTMKRADNLGIRVSTGKGLTLEQKETRDNNNEAEKLSIDGLPEGAVITTAIAPDRQHEMDEFRWIINSGHWNLKAVDHGDELWMTMKPKITDGVENIGEGRYLDTRIASIDKAGNLITKPDSGYEIFHEGVVKQKDGILFRGLSKEEMDDIISTREIKSRGDVVKDIGAHVGLTFFSENPEISLGYATAQRIPGYRSPTFDNPNYLVMVNDPGVHDVEGESEIGIGTAIPSEQIVRIYEVRPIMIKEGEIPLQQSSDGKIAPGEGIRLYNHAPQIDIALKDVTEKIH